MSESSALFPLRQQCPNFVANVLWIIAQEKIYNAQLRLFQLSHYLDLSY